MARTALVPRALVANGNLIGSTGSTTIDATLVTNGAVIDACKADRTILRVTNTEGSTNTVTIKAGDNPPALGQGLGDLVVTVAATTGVQYIGPFESGRFIQGGADVGDMHIDFESAMTGTIDALLLPRTV